MRGQTEGGRGRRFLAALAPLALAALLACLLLAVLWMVSLADVPGTETPIITYGNEDGLPDIAASRGGDYVALAWSRGRDSTTGPAGYVYLDIASEAAGKWRPWVQVYPQSATSSNMAREARIAFDPRLAYSTMLHMVWNQKTASGFSRILYARCDVTNSSNCAAAAIGARTVVDDAANGPNQPDVAVDEAGNIHVVWVTSAGDVRYKCSSDGGTTWQPVAPLLVMNAFTVTQPSIAYANSKLHIVWAEGTTSSSVFNTIGYRPGDNACPTTLGIGKTFPTSLEAARDPKVAAAGNTVYVVWDLKTSGTALGGNVITYYLVYNRSTDGGGTWAPADYFDIPTASSASFTGRSVYNNRLPYNYDYGSRLHPDVTLEVTGSNTIAHVAWQESTVDWDRNEGTFNIFYTAHNGSSWIAPTAVTAGTPADDIFSVMPAIAVGKNGLHIAYMREKLTGQQTPEDWDIYYYGLLGGPPQSGVYLPLILKNQN